MRYQSGRRGTPTNDDALAGHIGEYIEAKRLAAGALALTSGVAATLASIVLTGGDWDVTSATGFLPAATTSITLEIASVSQVDNATPAQDDGTRTDVISGAFVPGANLGSRIPTQPRRIKVAAGATTTAYSVGAAIFTVSTMSGYTVVRGRRMR